MSRLALLLTAVALAAAMVTAGPISRARADGDPASDVLASQSLFFPGDGGFSQSEEAQLDGLLSAAARDGYPIRVALIATPADLGSISALWRNPSGYAQFLGAELKLVYHGTLLVVMPDGFGVDDVGAATGATVSGATSIPVPRPGTPMVAATIAAVTHLASAAGHHLTPPTAPVISSTGYGSALGSVDPGSWVALAIGAGLIALAWTASLRARPPARRRRVAAGGGESVG
jgi:hypothetical protein